MAQHEPDPKTVSPPAVDLASLPEDLQQQFLARHKERALARAAAARPQRAPRVLVVEDDAESADMLEAVLQQMGYETRSVRDGAEVLEAARAFAPDAVLMDINLPHRDGYSLAIDMHADPALRDVPLVAVTGLVGPRDRDRAMEAGFAQHMAKPVSPVALQSALGALLRNRSAAPLPRT